MLRKVLKYDLGAIFKLWLIMSITSLLLGALGGVALRVIMTPNPDLGATHFDGWDSIATMFLGISVIGIIAYMIITFIFVIYRYYQNFFTDEGYLTFTLPVL